MGGRIPSNSHWVCSLWHDENVRGEKFSEETDLTTRERELAILADVHDDGVSAR